MGKIGCYDCGLEYGSDGWIEAIVPDYVWNLIRPEVAEGSDGLLCISCICKRISELRFDEKVPCFVCGTEPIEIFSQEHKKKEFILRKWKPKVVGE
jgi:hypothetical protein